MGQAFLTVLTRAVLCDITAALVPSALLAASELCVPPCHEMLLEIRTCSGLARV